MIDAVVMIPVLLGGLILGPVFGYFVGSRLRTAAQSWRPGRVAGATALIVAAPFVVLSPWSLYGMSLDAAVVAGAWCSYCSFSFAIRENRNQAVFLLMAIPMAAGIIIGLLLSTVGALGLMLIGGNLSQVSEGRITTRCICRFEPFGGATARTNGVVLSVLYRPALFPLFEKVVHRQRYEHTDYDYDQIDCKPLAANDVVVRARRLTGAFEEWKVTVNPW